MFCPVCKAEYTPGITRCVDDGAELVEHLPEKTANDLNDEARFVALCNVSLPAQAEMIGDVLRQNNIRVAVQSNADAFAPLLAATSGGTAVLVDERDFVRAQELYNAFFNDDASNLNNASSGDTSSVESVTDKLSDEREH